MSQAARLIPYAGYEQTDAEEAREAAWRRHKNNRNAMRAYNMFIRGKDTLDIAQIMGRKEPLIVRWIDHARAFRKGLSYPYEARK